MQTEPMQLSLEQAQAIYIEQPLNYLVQLKYLQHHPNAITCYQSSSALLMVCQVADFAWDSFNYPQAETMFLPSVKTAADAVLLADFMKQHWDFSQPCVFKFHDEETRQYFQQQFNLTPVRTYYTYTTSQAADAFQLSERVSIVTQAAALPLDIFNHNNHSAEEIAHLLSQGALVFAIQEDQVPVCACVAYRNFADIWEVGALYTLPQARRKGYARMVVETALHTLRSRQLIPRYHVESTNAPSFQLVESLGLARSLTFAHFLSAAAE